MEFGKVWVEAGKVWLEEVDGQRWISECFGALSPSPTPSALPTRRDFSCLWIPKGVGALGGTSG